MDPVVWVNENMKEFLFDKKREVYFDGTDKDLVSLVKKIIAERPLNLDRADEYHNFASDKSNELEKFRYRGKVPARVKFHTRVMKRTGNELHELEIQGFTPYSANELAVARLSAA